MFHLYFIQTSAFIFLFFYLRIFRLIMFVKKIINTNANKIIGFFSFLFHSLPYPNMIFWDGICYVNLWIFSIF